MGECNSDTRTIDVAVGPKSRRVSRKTVKKRLIHEIAHAVRFQFEEKEADMLADTMVDENADGIVADLMKAE